MNCDSNNLKTVSKVLDNPLWVDRCSSMKELGESLSSIFEMANPVGIRAILQAYLDSITPIQDDLFTVHPIELVARTFLENNLVFQNAVKLSKTSSFNKCRIWTTSEIERIENPIDLTNLFFTSLDMDIQELSLKRKHTYTYIDQEKAWIFISYSSAMRGTEDAGNLSKVDGIKWECEDQKLHIYTDNTELHDIYTDEMNWCFFRAEEYKEFHKKGNHPKKRKVLDKRDEVKKLLKKHGAPDIELIGVSDTYLEFLSRLLKISENSDESPLLLIGETGVGKTYHAELLHYLSQRYDKPLVSFSGSGTSGGADPNLVRGLFVGYTRGHGLVDIAKEGQPGAIMKARGGSLLFDELQSASQGIQEILRHALEGKEVITVGSEHIIPDVRFIFFCNQPLNELRRKGILLKDLSYRISFTLRIPTLRERKADILLLAKHFIGIEYKFSDCAKLALLKDRWEGNIRELKNTMRAAKLELNAAKKKVVRIANLKKEEKDAPAGISNHILEEVTQVKEMGNCKKELWQLAVDIAKNDGYEDQKGLQRYVGQILGYKASYVNKQMHKFDII